MIPPTGMAIAAVTVMLWLVWSDTVRARRSSQMIYAVRVALYLIVAGIFVLNTVRYPLMFGGNARLAAFFAAAVGVLGAAYFGRRLVRRL
jgi:hypothetical protein